MTTGIGGYGLLTRRPRDRRIMQVLLTVMALLWLFPLYAALRDALRVNGWGNFTSLFTDPLGGIPLWRTYVNSIVLGVLHAAVVVFVSTTAGYAFSKLHFRGREVLFYATILLLAIPGTAILVPLYNITLHTNLFDNYLGVALPEAALTIPFGVLLMRNYGESVPNELVEAATMDRAGHVRIFRSVFLPLARPAIVNLVVLCVMWSLQDFLWPVLFFYDPDRTTAAQAVQTLSGSLGTSPAEAARYSASLVLLAVPAVVLVVFGLRFITGGLTSGAVKD